ncbi:hypothetical protein GO755_00365 [Spirosoma sp. HMF4905]|uniref:DUF2306 domain-containing protein n=1 Tax=Spirosoma arboris TaxID=2682092 RepID=A0A7K1S3R8_9BACT|nr:hypothetical protein [Spirosoma arboris]MVM28464.1 hypothetical protein [Spirosoma arboris]
MTPSPVESVAAIRPIHRGRYFFVGMAILFFIISIVGFTPSYQGMSSGSLKFHWFVHVHGAIMTSWLAMFLAQSVLAARGNLKYHRKLGQIGFVLGILVYLVAGITSTRARLSLYLPVESELWDILLVELYSMNLFGLFFTWGMLVRKNVAAHKRLLLLATIALMGAGIDRTSWLPGLYSAFYVRFIYLDTLVIALFFYDWITLRRIHQISLIGMGIIVALQTTITLTFGSPAWHQFWYNRFAPFVEKPVEIKLSEAQATPLLGNYGDKSWHLTVSREGDKLFLKLPNQPKWALGATADTALFVKTMIWNLTFAKGADGQVTQLTNTQGPLVWKVSKLK